MDDYYESPRIGFANGAQFVRVCPHCGRFVKANKAIYFYEDGRVQQPNAKCSKCGRVAMPFEGYL